MTKGERALLFVIFLQFLGMLSLISTYSKGQVKYIHCSNMIEMLSENLKQCRSEDVE